MVSLYVLSAICIFWRLKLFYRKADLREDKQFKMDYPGASTISTEQGEELKKQIGAVAYVECCAKTQQNVKAVFDAAIKVVLQPPKPKRQKRKLKVCRVL